MELTKDEMKLIEAVRELREPSYNILLWYSAGLEDAQKKSKSIGNEYRVKQDQVKIDIANRFMKEM